jgi:hypothetical protein
MREFSATQSNRIAQASMEISRRRSVVERIADELDASKENMKMAKQELESAYRALDALTMDAASGIEPLPNLFEVGAAAAERDRNSNGEPGYSSPPLAGNRERIIRPGAKKEPQESTS